MLMLDVFCLLNFFCLLSSLTGVCTLLLHADNCSRWTIRWWCRRNWVLATNWGPSSMCFSLFLLPSLLIISIFPPVPFFHLLFIFEREVWGILLHQLLLPSSSLSLKILKFAERCCEVNEFGGSSHPCRLQLNCYAFYHLSGVYS